MSTHTRSKEGYSTRKSSTHTRSKGRTQDEEMAVAREGTGGRRRGRRRLDGF
jgi:hypothetical protein